MAQTPSDTSTRRRANETSSTAGGSRPANSLNEKATPPAPPPKADAQNQKKGAQISSGKTAISGEDCNCDVWPSFLSRFCFALCDLMGGSAVMVTLTMLMLVAGFGVAVYFGVIFYRNRTGSQEIIYVNQRRPHEDPFPVAREVSANPLLPGVDGPADTEREGGVSKPSEVRDQPVREPRPSRGQERKTVDDELKRLNEGISAIWSLIGSDADINDLNAALGAINQKNDLARQSAIDEIDVDEVLASAAVHCLVGGCAKWELRSLLSALKIETSLATHKNINDFVNDPASTLEFDLSEHDGCWLMCDLNDEVLAVPIDGRAFQIHPAHFLIRILFEGAENAGRDSVIRMIYRPCRFIRRPGENFALRRKGTLQFTDARDNANLKPPRDFGAIQSLTALRTPLVGNSSLMAIIKAQMDRLGAIESHLRSIDLRSEARLAAPALNLVDMVESSLTERVKALEVSSSALLDGNQRLNRVEQQLDAMTRRIEEERAQASALQRAAVVAGPPVEIEPKRMQEVRSEGKDLPSERWTEQTTYSEERVSPVSSHRQQSAGGDITVSTPAVPVANRSIAKEGNLPDSWTNVLATVRQSASLDAGSHSRALIELYDKLESAGASPIHLVHLTLSESKIGLRVHLGENRTGQVFCKTCESPRPLQSAICIGDPGALQLRLLVPIGGYSPSLYPAVYKILFKSLPREQFRITAIDNPALLVKQAVGEEYDVVQKVSWT